MSEKKTITLSGIILIEYSSNWESVKLIQENGYKIDLVSRFKEAVDSFGQFGTQVNYYLSDSPCTKNEMTEGWLKKISGAIDADYTTSQYHYSSWTNGTDYDTELTIGGHNLLSELRNAKGKFMIIEMNFKVQ